MDVKYTGRAHYRIISADNLAEKGVSDFETTRWAKGETKSVSAAAGEWLITNLSTEFEKVEPAATQMATESSTRTASSSSTSKTSSAK